MPYHGAKLRLQDNHVDKRPPTQSDLHSTQQPPPKVAI